MQIGLARCHVVVVVLSLGLSPDLLIIPKYTPFRLHQLHPKVLGAVQRVMNGPVGFYNLSCIPCFQ